MYPKNAASPPIIAVGQVILIADGSVVTADASARVKIGTGGWGAAGGTLACDTTSGCWTYVPSQAETNAESFLVAVYKASCIGCQVTVVTTASATAGKAYVSNIDDDAITAAAIANGAIDAATFAADVDAEILSYIVDDATRIDASSLNTAAVTSIPAILDDTGTSGVVVASASKTGYTLTATTGLGNQTANITGNLSGSVGSVTGAVGSVTAGVTVTTNNDKSGYNLTATTGLGNQTSNITGTVSGNSTHSAADVVTALGTGSTLTALATAAALDTVDNFLDTEIAAILADTDELQKAITDGGRTDLLIDAIKAKTDNMLDSTDIATALTTAWTTTTLPEDYPADGAEATPAELLYLILSGVTQFNVSGTTLTQYKLNKTTPAATYTLDSATAPTQRLRAT